MGKNIKKSRTQESFARQELIPTFAESLLLFRREKGFNQARMAKLLKTTIDLYKVLEYGIAHGTNEQIEKFQLTRELHPNEKCLLYRKRDGKSQRDLVEQVGFSRYWIGLMERGKVPCSKLLEYWEGGRQK